MEASQSSDLWSNSAYDLIAREYLPMAGQLVERVGITQGDEVLDVGCGTGNVAITAARRGSDVTGIDITPAMLQRARKRAATAGVEPIDWQEADTTDLPFEDSSFDVTLSALGHMYAYPHEQTATELLRVTRPGGYVGFTAWTPTSLFPFIGGVVTTYLSPEDQPEFSEPPFVWGDSTSVRERLGAHVDRLAFETDRVRYPVLSPAQFWDEMATHSGVFREYLDRVDDADRQSLDEEVIETIQPYFDQQRNAVELEFLLTVATV